MRIRCVCSTIGAGLLLSATVFAQENTQGAARQSKQVASAQQTPITLVGCIQRESEYRREHNIGRGGAAATGLGLSDEYVLINASKTGATAAPADIAGADCAAAAGEAYELTGSREHDLKPFVGKRVEITGMLKPAATKPEATGTAGETTPRPTGGVDPLGRDLRLFEVNVTSFKAVSVNTPQSGVAAQPVAPEPRPQSTTPPIEQPTGTTTAPQSLPRTASVLPLFNAIGLLALSAALVVRWRRQAADR